MKREDSSTSISQVLAVAFLPYFLERSWHWFEKNEAKILRARKWQAFWKDNSLFLEKGQSIKLSHILRALDEMGYEKVLKVELPAEFSHRGNLIDLFPVNHNQAIRLEFLGNRLIEIKKIGPRLINEKTSKEILKKKIRSQKTFSDLKNLKPGHYLVHLDHGIGRFQVIKKVKLPDRPNLSYYVLEYGQSDLLYVPLGLERKLSRYLGFVTPKLSRLAGTLWQKTKKKIKEDAELFARELLKIYSQRELTSRPRLIDHQGLEKIVASGFDHEETPDQLKALAEIKKDFQKDRPMDRLVCGDVGFGKTEIALRAIAQVVGAGFKAVMICPTTVLADQHFQNFKKRLEGLGPTLALLSRLQSGSEQKKIIEDLQRGKIDVLIGTHRLLSKDVMWPKAFQLLVIDDEHRFGVRQKEKLKRLKSQIDVLSLTATPIPRTLYLALSGLRSMSLVQTPPEARKEIKTFVRPFSEKMIKQALLEELKRGGQVYYLYNRVGTMERAFGFLERLVAKTTIAMVHGRLPEKELVKSMADFRNGKIDILIATTIIEAGLDLANANTLIVADATLLGLAELYQLRGRVGRSWSQAQAFFFYPQKRLTPRARARLRALKRAQALGSGYQIALKDLEIRGAGNILGKEQSGSVNKVGLNLYCQMIAQALERIKAGKSLFSQ